MSVTLFFLSDYLSIFFFDCCVLDTMVSAKNSVVNKRISGPIRFYRLVGTEVSPHIGNRISVLEHQMA